jgi:hypothetical protein
MEKKKKKKKKKKAIEKNEGTVGEVGEERQKGTQNERKCQHPDTRCIALSVKTMLNDQNGYRAYNRISQIKCIL